MTVNIKVAAYASRIAVLMLQEVERSIMNCVKLTEQETSYINSNHNHITKNNIIQYITKGIKITK